MQRFAIFTLLLAAAIASAYIAVDGRRLTLCEVMLEFPTVSLLEIDAVDPRKGAFLCAVKEALQGDKAKAPTCFALLERGALPEAFKGLKKGDEAVCFSGSPDNRSLVYMAGAWFLTKPEGGWERFNGMRPDMHAIWTPLNKPAPGRLADAVRDLRKGEPARVFTRAGKVPRLGVIYDPEFPHRRRPWLTTDLLRRRGGGPRPGRLREGRHAGAEGVGGGPGGSQLRSRLPPAPRGGSGRGDLAHRP